MAIKSNTEATIKLTKSVVAQATELAIAFIGETSAKRDYEALHDKQVKERKDRVYDILVAACEATEGSMVNLTKLQALFITEFKKEAWTRSGRKGEVVARPDKNNKDAWPTLGVYSSWIKSLFLAGNISKARVLQIRHVGGHPNATEPFDGFAYLKSAPSWKEFLERATKIRKGAVAAGYIDAAQGPEEGRARSAPRRLTPAKKQALMDAVSKAVNTASDGRALVYMALSAFMRQAPAGAAVAAHLTKATDDFLAEVNRWLEPAKAASYGPNQAIDNKAEQAAVQAQQTPAPALPEISDDVVIAAMARAAEQQFAKAKSRKQRERVKAA